MKPESIKPYPNNPRANDGAVDAVATSIKSFGFKNPIIVDGNMTVICGHTRLRAAIKLGLEEIPVIVAADLTPEQVRAYRLADNRTSELSGWDYDLLALEVTGLKDSKYDIEILGWDVAELERMINGLGNEPPPDSASGKEFDESAADDVATVTCPKCGTVFPK
jgi:ParB-like chromosome segregation protein Spo0J